MALKQTDLLQQLLVQYRDQKLSHAFLLETNNVLQCLLEIKEFLKHINCEEEFQENCDKCNLCHLINNSLLPNLLIIEPDGQVIKKEQIIELKKMFQTKPVFSKYNMYIIKNAECLNSSSANTMLKFLEEPDGNILGFFITNNKENVIDTIKSRCQIFFAHYPLEVEKINEEYENLAISFIKEVEMVKDQAIFYVDELTLKLTKISDYQYLLKVMLKIYLNLYNEKINNKEDSIKELAFIKKQTEQYLFKKIKIIKELLEQIQCNVNTQLLLERFVLES